MKKLTSLLLASLMLISVLASCATDDKPVDTTAADTTAADTTTAEVTTEPEIVPEVPADKKYDGYEFKLLTNDETNTIRSSFEIEAEDNGEVMNAAVFKRNLAVKEALGVTVKHLQGKKASNGWIKDFQNAVKAGDDAYDMLVADQTNILKNSANYGAEVSQLKYVDLEKPWWDDRVIKATAIAGKTFGLTGDMNLVDDGATWGIMFNKTFAKNHGMNVDEMYQLARDGKWTLDRYQEYCSKVSRDVNGDGKMDMYDEWGVATSGNAILSMLFSCGGSVSSLDKDNKPVITVDTELNMTILNRLFEFAQAGDNCLFASMTPNEQGKADFNLQRSVFIEGRALFIHGTICYTYQYFRDMQDDYGVLPNPKWNEDQKDYITTAQEWGANMWMASKVGSDLERTSIILEVIGYNSGKTIVPAYYDQVMNVKSVRDEQSVEMLEILFDSRTTYQLAMAYSWGKTRTIATELEKDTNTLASFIASNKAAIETAAQKSYDDIIKATSAQ